MSPCEGVTIMDMGHKIGCNGVDNGQLRFNHYVAPRCAGMALITIELQIVEGSLAQWCFSGIGFQSTYRRGVRMCVRAFYGRVRGVRAADLLSALSRM
jgi:hypothetical protein